MIVPGLWTVNVSKSTAGAFTTSRSHHFLSFVTMLGPSPDWITGNDTRGGFLVVEKLVLVSQVFPVWIFVYPIAPGWIVTKSCSIPLMRVLTWAFDTT